MFQELPVLLKSLGSMEVEAMNDDVRDLLERAIHDLANGWPAAAYDCLIRAMRLLEERLAAEVSR